MNNFLSKYEDKNLLLNWYSNEGRDLVLKSNAHIHTPYSFSAFSGIDQAVEMAAAEKVEILGINDFFVTDGYEEFHRKTVENYIFPLFNIEFIGLLKEEQAKGIRVNDPNNPGRTYFSGKGLDFPVSIPAKERLILEKIKIESQIQVVEMIEKLNHLLEKSDVSFRISYDEIKVHLAKDLVRERHIARALNLKLNEHYQSDKDKLKVLESLYGSVPKSPVSDHTATENEIRSNLLKAGGAAFVPENEDAFLPIETIIQFIVKGGGIPTYPVLLDDNKGNYTEFEADLHKLMKRLQSLNVFSVELIPNRNSAKELRKFVDFFHKNNFIITLGTEHNSPELFNIQPVTRGNTPLEAEINEIAFEGCCVIAAHQYLRAHGQEGYIDQKGVAKTNSVDQFINIGKAVIDKFLRC